MNLNRVIIAVVVARVDLGGVDDSAVLSSLRRSRWEERDDTAPSCPLPGCHGLRVALANLVWQNG